MKKKKKKKKKKEKVFSSKLKKIMWENLLTYKLYCYCINMSGINFHLNLLNEIFKAYVDKGFSFFNYLFAVLLLYIR